MSSKRIPWFLENFTKGRLNPFVEPEAPSTSYEYFAPVHQLWPPADHICSTNFDVVFFPGLRQLGDPDNDWFQNWLPQDLGGNVRVLALHYGVTNDISNDDEISCIGENLLRSLVLSARWALGQSFMIGHSFGGLVMKRLVVEAYRRAYPGARNALQAHSQKIARRFLENLKGIAFYAVPKAHSEDCAFNAIMEEFSINVCRFIPGKPTTDMAFKLVTPRYAWLDYYVLEDCDFLTVCKPPSRDHPSYSMLLDFIRVCREEVVLERLKIPNFAKPIRKLFEGLMDGESEHILVHGNAGTGKTALVDYVLFHYAKFLLNKFSGGIFRLQYGQDDSLITQSQKDLLRSLVPWNHEMKGFESLRSSKSILDMLQEELNKRPGPWLLFIDDVWDGKSIPQSPFPSNQSCKLLLTSRFKLKDLPAIRVSLHEATIYDIATRLLASTAANDPDETEFPLGCEDIAKQILDECENCLLAVKILGIVLREVPKIPIAWEKVATRFKYHIDSIDYIPDGYRFGSNTLHAAIISSFWYGEDETDIVGMGNVLQAIALFNNQKVPTDVVKVAWCCLQAPGANGYFDSSLRKLVRIGLVEETRRLAKDGKEYFHELEIHDLVREFVLMEMGSVNLTSLMEEEEVKGREKVLILLLMIYGGKEVREYAIAQVPSLSYLPLDVETDSPKVSSLMTDFLTYGLVKALDLPAMEGHFSTPSPQVQDICISEDWRTCEITYPKITKIQRALEMTQDKTTSKPSVIMASASNLHGFSVPDIERSDEVSSSIDFELGGDVGVGTLQSQATSKFAEHRTVLRITKVFDKVITSAQQLLDSQNGGNSIKVVGRQDKMADAYEFFFESAECMSKVVGVGLEWAKVVICMECGSVKVLSINETAWQDSWHQVEKDVVVLSIDLANIRKEGRNIYSLTAEEASKKFGVGVHPQGPDYNHGGVNAFFVEEKGKDVAFYPLIWELAHYMAWNCKQHAGSESRNSGARSWWGIWGPTTSSQSKGSSSNNQAGDDAVDNSGAPANLCDGFPNVARDPKKDKTLIVTVILPDEKISNPQNMTESQLDDRIKDASIYPVLEFKFELPQGVSRKITIESRTQCNLGDSAPESRDRGYLGYYQDDITISLSCTGKKSDGSQAARLLNQVTIPNSKDKKRSECDTYGQSESCARQKCGQITGQLTLNPMHMVTLGGTIQGGRNQTNTSGDSTSHASTSEVTMANCVSGYVWNPSERAASWKCNFSCEHKVWDYVEQGDDGAYKRLKSSGIFNTFWPSIVSVWGNLDDKEACPYEFKTKRDIISIQDEIKRRSIQAIQDHVQTPAVVPTPEPKLQHYWRFWSKKQTLAAPQDTPAPDIMVMGPEISTESQNLQQVYEKTMCVNIAMTHVIREYEELILDGQENKPETGITIGVQGPPQVNAETG